MSFSTLSMTPYLSRFSQLSCMIPMALLTTVVLTMDYTQAAYISEGKSLFLPSASESCPWPVPNFWTPFSLLLNASPVAKGKMRSAPGRELPQLHHPIRTIWFLPHFLSFQPNYRLKQGVTSEYPQQPLHIFRGLDQHTCERSCSLSLSHSLFFFHSSPKQYTVRGFLVENHKGSLWTSTRHSFSCRAL